MGFPRIIYDMDFYRQQLSYVSSFNLFLFHWHVGPMKVGIFVSWSLLSPVTRIVPGSSTATC